MKKFYLLVIAIFIFGCETSTRTTETRTTETTPAENATSEESVAKGAGSEISPQLEGVEDSASRLEVDPISSPAETK